MTEELKPIDVSKYHVTEDGNILKQSDNRTELEKEAENESYKQNSCDMIGKAIYAKGYIAGAEPREKRIAELEKERGVIRRKADEAIADKLLITAKYNEILNDLNQEKDNLQKENAKAKEIIKDLLGSENRYCEEEMFFTIRRKAEDFIKE